jgi:hypothetical protein
MALPDYDRALINSLAAHRDTIVLGRYPTLPPAPLFSKAVGAIRVGALDLQTDVAFAALQPSSGCQRVVKP